MLRILFCFAYLFLSSQIIFGDENDGQNAAIPLANYTVKTAQNNTDGGPVMKITLSLEGA